MKYFLILVFLILVNVFGYSQGRISVDVSSQLQKGANITFNYHHILKDKLLITGGFFIGGNGRSFNDMDTISLNEGKRLYSPYSKVNEPIVDSTGTYNLLAYRTLGNHVGIEIGIGSYVSLNENNSIRGHIYSKIGKASVLINGYYRNKDNYTTIEKNQFTTPYYFTSLSFEAYHVIKISPRMTFYWGAKVPFYFLIDKERFNPTHTQDLHYGFEPEFTGGLTFYVGKSNAAKPTED